MDMAAGGLASLPVVNGHFNELLVGEELNSPEDINRIWDRLYDESMPYGRKGISMMALSGVDLALWDTLGKAECKPVAELIGGIKKDQIEVLRHRSRFGVVRRNGSLWSETHPSLERDN